MSIVSCSLGPEEDLQQRVQSVSTPYDSAKQVTNNEPRSPEVLHAEALPEEIEEELDTWKSVGNRSTQALTGVLAGVRVVLGSGLVGLIRIGMALVQDPSEGWRIRQREEAARRQRGGGRRGGRRVVLQDHERLDGGLPGSMMADAGNMRGGGMIRGPPAGVVVRSRARGRGGEQARGASGSAGGHGGRGGGRRRSAGGGGIEGPEAGVIPLRGGQRSGRR